MMLTDSTGEFPILAIAATILIEALYTGLTNALVASATGQNVRAAFWNR